MARQHSRPGFAGRKAHDLPAIACIALLGAAACRAAAPPVLPAPTPEELAQIRSAEAAYRAMPDEPGTGPYPATKLEEATLPGHTVYRPANLDQLGATRMPIVVWGNGGCAGDGAAQRLHLLEIASHGYLVIANGPIRSGPGTSPPPPPPAAPANAPMKLPKPQNSARDLVEAIDWAVAQDGLQGGPYAGRIATQQVAVSGFSCGGVQALTVASSDARVKAAVIHNSGLFPDGTSLMEGMDLPKAALDRLRAPIIYILGGTKDIAYANGMDDYRRISTVPVAVANLPVGHGGTFMEHNGGRAAAVAVAWLDWRLKGDAAAAAWFTGAGCRLCNDGDWTFASKGL